MEGDTIALPKFQKSWQDVNNMVPPYDQETWPWWTTYKDNMKKWWFSISFFFFGGGGGTRMCPQDGRAVILFVVVQKMRG